jgi:O-acetyl-ADP-ribose deacetylase (regulator of RNase III)
MTTSAYKLLAKHIIHAVGPLYLKDTQNASETLRKAVLNMLQKAEELEAKTIAMPAISCGVFMFPKKEAADVIYDAIVHYLTVTPETWIGEIRVTIKDIGTLSYFVKEFDRRYPAELTRIKLTPQ